MEGSDISTRGWEHVTRSDLGTRSLPIQKPSKYKNVKVTIDGQRFDSKREADYWLWLQERARRGEINTLVRQVPFALCAPDRTNFEDQHSRTVVIATYVADFSYYDRDGHRHVVDVKGGTGTKGTRTALYALKAKWLCLQDGVVVEEV